MKHAALILVTVALVVAALAVVVLGAAGEAAPSAQNAVTATSVPADGRAFIVLYTDGSWRYAAEPTQTPTPTTPATNTPRPSATSTATVSVTLSPTASATATVIQTATPTTTAAATDTLEATLELTLPPVVPSATPTEAPTLTPVPQTCTFTPLAGLNIRDSMWGTVIARFGSANNASTSPPTIQVQTIRATARAIDAKGAAWLAFWLDEETFGWVYGGFVTLAGSCDDLPVTPERVLIGPHLLYSASAVTLWSLLSVAGVTKEVSGDGKLLAAAHAANPDAVTVYRYVDGVVGSCSPDWMDGRQWFDTLYARWPRGADYYEIENECGETSRAYSNSHVIETMQAANDRGVCLILYSFGVGNPSVEFMKTITPALDYALEHECQPGRHHAIGLHAYGLGYPRENTWLFSGWRRLCGAIPGYCERLGVWMTEWEWYGEESDPVNCAQVVANARWALDAYQDTPIWGAMQWSYGPLNPWRDLTSCASTVAAWLET